jgi:hypothetical protein
MFSSSPPPHPPPAEAGGGKKTMQHLALYKLYTMPFAYCSNCFLSQVLLAFQFHFLRQFYLTVYVPREIDDLEACSAIGPAMNGKKKKKRHIFIDPISGTADRMPISPAKSSHW